MKRKRQTVFGMRYSDVHAAFTADQLMGIGAVAMQYNEAEANLKKILGECIEYPGNDNEVISRINGLDGVIQIIFQALKAWKYADISSLFSNAIKGNDGFEQLKKFRDAVIHARLHDQRTGIAEYHGSKGVVEEVLLTKDSLARLYSGLKYLEMEFDIIWQLIGAKQSRREESSDADQQREQLAKFLQEAMAQCQDYQRKRQALGPYPEFPKGRPTNRLPPLRTGIRQKKPE